MTYAALVRRGRNLLLVCLAVVLAGMVMSDLQWGGLFGSQARTLGSYLVTVALGAIALRGNPRARQLLAGLLLVSAFFTLARVLMLGTLLPGLSAWLLAHATVNTLVAGVLLLSPDIARYESSKNRLLLT